MGWFLEAIGEATGFFEWPPEGSREWIYREVRASKKNYHRYHNAVGYLKRQKLMKVVARNGKKFLQLTSKGQLQLLLAQARLPNKPKVWDKKWRLIIFDIPESSRNKRALLRQLLKQNGFFKLQGSVFINPYPLNRKAIEYLRVSGLMDYIRIMRVDEVDDDTSIRKKFKLV